PTAVDRTRKMLSLSPSRPVVMYTGNFESYQGIDLLIASMPRVLERSPNAVFMLVGARAQEMARLQRQLTRRITEDQVRLVPRIAQDQMPTYFQMADVLVSPRIYGDNLPLKVIEYLASERPIVATDI